MPLNRILYAEPAKRRLLFYAHLTLTIDGLPDAPAPEEEIPAEPETESVLTNAQVKALLLDLQRRIAAQEENTEFLGGCIMEMGEVVYG